MKKIMKRFLVLTLALCLALSAVLIVGGTQEAQAGGGFLDGVFVVPVTVIPKTVPPMSIVTPKPDFKLAEVQPETETETETDTETGSGTPASGKPVILQQPSDATVMQGKKLSVTISQSGATGITWRFYNPATGEEYLGGEIGSRIKGLKVSGKNSTNLRLSNIPAELSGWQVYCTLGNKQGRVVTRYATITVVDKNGNVLGGAVSAPQTVTEAPALAVTPAPAAAYVPAADNQDGIVTVVAKGAAYLQQRNGNGGTGAKNTQMEFNGTADFFVGVDVPKGKKVEYWVINGVRYEFNKKVAKISVTDLTWDLTIEAVLSGRVAETVLTKDQIQQSRTGERLEVTSIHAKMCHIRANNKGAGGYFTSFDFTQDYVNQATNQRENGGSVTVQTKALIPNGKKISYWKFNDAHFRFGSNVTSFIVRDQNATFEYEPVFGKTSTPEPEPTVTTKVRTQQYVVKCIGCYFSGGGYTKAIQGTVDPGTKIKIHSDYSYTDSWYVNGSKYYMKGWYDLGGVPNQISLTIKKNTEIKANQQIN